MRVRIIDTRAIKPGHGSIRLGKHIVGILGAMTTLDQRGTAVTLHDAVGGGLHILLIANQRIGQYFGFGNVRSHDRSHREQLAGQGRNGIVTDELGTGSGHHNRVEHDVRGVMEGESFSNDVDDVSGRHHADFHRDRRNILKHHVDLVGENVRFGVLNGTHAGGVLCGERGDGAHAEHAASQHGLQIGLHAGTAGRVGAGDRENSGKCRCCNLCHSVHSKWGP